MTLCINPQCPRPQNSKNILFCQACGSELLLEGRYRVTRQLGAGVLLRHLKLTTATLSKS
ncbi:4-Cys prefix domain-containing protein [Nostoc sp.]|uniref:4-Cys prefix domain-containing protein n=1 Tax=Nostoc sp. TaxID=1180 RepID=UPI002FF0413F